MSWLSNLAEVYDLQSQYPSQSLAYRDIKLEPLSHVTKKCDIEITLDSCGNYVSARMLDFNESVTLVPATPEAGFRRNSVVSRGITEELLYLVSDLESQLSVLDVTAMNKGQANLYKQLQKAYTKSQKAYGSYISLMESWHNFEPNQNLGVVLQYIKGGTLLLDLKAEGILQVDSNGDIIPMILKTSSSKKVKKVKGVPLGIYDRKKALHKIMCRFTIIDDKGEIACKTYDCAELRDSWLKYMAYLEKTHNSKDICYISGESETIARLHPKTLRCGADEAVLISSNDETIRTYRGRFTTAQEACAISSTLSAKAHTALRWLIARQGYTCSNKPCNSIDANSRVYLIWGKGIETINRIDTSNFGGFSKITIPEFSFLDTEQQYAERIYTLLEGHKQTLSVKDNISVMILDSATKGRMAVLYYNEFSVEEFLNKLKKWYESCSWLMDYFIKVADEDSKPQWKKYSCFGTPSLLDIVYTVYGPSAFEASKSKQTANLYTLLHSCVLGEAQLPPYVVNAAIRRVINRSSYLFDKRKGNNDDIQDTNDTDKDERNRESDWHKGLAVTCALYKKFNEEEQYTMALDESRNTRDYLFGRVLAVIENIEDWALRLKQETRATNAQRYFAQYSMHPVSTLRILENKLSPYLMYLGPKANSRRMLMSEIINKIADIDGFLSTAPLSGEFLLGYHQQKYALKQVFAKNKDTDSEVNK